MTIVLPVVIISVLYLFSCSKTRNAPEELVNPSIGGISPLLQTTVPLVSLPNSMMRLYRMPGNYQAEKVIGFPFVLCGHRNGTAGLLMPVSGDLNRNQDTWESYFDHDYEVCKPYYYSVWLKDPDLNLEFTPSSKSVIYRLVWNRDSQRDLMLALSNKGTISITDKNTVEGYEIYEDRIKVFFYLKTQDGFITDSLGKKETVAISGTGDVEGNGCWAGLNFGQGKSTPLLFKMAVSFVSAAQAKKNLEEDISGWDFEKVRTTAKDTWNKALGKIEVKGGTIDQQVAFYTALYRNYERMVNISEDGFYYSGFDDKIHADNDTAFFVDDWMWDTYRASHPLMAMLDPETEGIKIQSYIRMYKQSGWMPSFPILFGDNPCMNGHHSAAIIADAWFKGIRNFDIEKAYEGLKKNAMEATMLPWRNGPMCSLDSFYLDKGFYPALQIGEKETVPMVHSFEKRQAVAITLAHSYDDWCLSQLAKSLGKDADYEYFLKRSQNFKNLYNSATGFFAPKAADGTWIRDFDPRFSGGLGNRDYYDENNGWTYLWDVQHNIPELITLMGGRTAFVKRLDQLFTEPLGKWKPDYLQQMPDATGQVGQFVMGNEPGMHIPYLYNYAGAPWKTQERVRSLLDTWFTNSPFGIPGDEDGGGLSAFVVFSSMGFYPVTPGAPIFNIGSPVFSGVKITLGNGKVFSVTAANSSRQNKYVIKAMLNGKDLDKTWFAWDDIKNGGELVLTMADRPDYKWGTAESASPALWNEKR